MLHEFSRIILNSRCSRGGPSAVRPYRKELYKCQNGQVEYGGQPSLICSRQYEDEDHGQAIPQISIESQRWAGVRPKGCRICRVPRAPCFPLIDFEGNHVSVSFEHDPSACMLLVLGNQQHLLRSCLTTGDLDGGPQPLKRKALIALHHIAIGAVRDFLVCSLSLF